MSGDLPPGWEDPEEENPGEAYQSDAEATAPLSDVAAYLASVPTPVLPDAVAARISAVLAAEAASRVGTVLPGVGHPSGAAAADGTDANGDGDGTRTPGPAPVRARVKRRRSGDGGWRALRPRPLTAAVAAVVCLLLAGLGYGLSRGGEPGTAQSSSAAESAGGRGYVPAVPQPASSALSPSAPSSVVPGSSVAPGIAGAEARFVVTASGIKYEQATLAAQVRARLAAPPATASGPLEVPGASAPGSPATAPSAFAAGRTSAPTAALRGCVSYLTGDQSPRLVDRATYQGESAYIIADSNRVWVVGLGCTAANPQLIASAPLAG